VAGEFSDAVLFVRPDDAAGIAEAINEMDRRGGGEGWNGFEAAMGAVKVKYGGGWAALARAVSEAVEETAPRCADSIFVSQQGQDVWAHDAFKGQHGRPGGRWFVELGANDGVTLSNTFGLEKCGGWRGVCIEPTAAFDSLMASGRVRCTKVREAVAGSTRTATLVGSKGDVDGLDTGGTLWAGLAEHFEEKATITGGVMDASSSRVLKSGGSEVVTTKTLGTLLDEVGAPKHLDFLSLDVEGAELEILESFPFEDRR
jgi:hypothetical protein